MFASYDGLLTDSIVFTLSDFIYMTWSGARSNSLS